MIKKIENIDFDLLVFILSSILLVLLLIVLIITSTHKVTLNTKAFQTGKELICVDFGRYHILKSNGWKCYGKYFIKDDRLVKIKKCNNK